MARKQPAAFWSRVQVDLTPEQKAAIAHVDGPLLVVAGPGSGKTTVITYRAAYLTQVAGIDPAALLVVTFTKAAADSMKARTARVAGAAVAARARFGTFHALAYHILRRADPSRRLRVLQEEEQLHLIRTLMRQGGLNTDDDTVLDALSEISRMRAEVEPPADFKPRRLTKTDFRQLWRDYQSAKAQQGLIDFDDMLHEALAALRARSDLLEAYRQRYTHLMVDEFQDTNPVQWELVRLLAEPRQNLCVVGDDDQAIYGWRGASPRFLLQFPRQYPQARAVVLDVNHRCPAPVVAAANRLAAQNRERFGKTIRPAGEQGGAPIELLAPADSLREAEAIVQLIKRSQAPLSHWAVIYRTNQQGHVIAQALARESIPYRALGGLPNLYRRWPVQDVLCYLRAAAGEVDAIEPVINRPNRYISRAVMQEAKRIARRRGIDLLDALFEVDLLRSWQLRPIEELIDHLRRMAPMTAPEAIGYVRRFIGYDEYVQEYCARQGGSSDEILGLLSEVERTTPPELLVPFLAQVDSFTARGGKAAAAGEEAVTLVTCHKAKGLEFPRVVVAGAIDRLLPHRGAEDLEEERRLMYVAMTRCAERLWISAPRAYEGREAQPSPFLAEALGPEADRLLAEAAGAEEAAPDPAIRPVPKPVRHRRRRLGEPPAQAEPVDGTPHRSELAPGTPVLHPVYGEGRVESVDPAMRRVIIDFQGRRISLDLNWCRSSRRLQVLAGD